MPVARFTAAVLLLFVGFGLSACKTVRYAEPPVPIVTPAVTTTGSIPALRDVRYRAIGRVPFVLEAVGDNGLPTRLEGYVTVSDTERNTLRLRTFVERIHTKTKNGRGLDLSVQNGLLFDIEIDGRGYPRRIHQTPGNVTVTGAGGIDTDALRVQTLDVVFLAEVEPIREFSG
jgi:hypothetical protein